MTRVVQRIGERGSLKWIQRAVNERPKLIEPGLLHHIEGARRIEWLSPLKADQFAEYRDAAFLERLGAGDLKDDLAAFWPRGGPQWDALARTDQGDLLLLEAKAHIPEMFSAATQAGETSRVQIERALAQTIGALGAAPKAPWAEAFFQLANRFAFLWFLRSRGKPAWLVLVNFIGDSERRGPSTAAEWEAAYQVVDHVMGLSRRHKLARYVVHLYPHVSALA